MIRYVPLPRKFDAEQTAQSSAELSCVSAHHSIESDENGCFPKCATSISPKNQSSSKQVGLLRGKQVMSYSSYCICSYEKRDVSGTMAKLPASDGRFYRPTVTVNAGGPFCRCMRALKCCRSCSRWRENAAHHGLVICLSGPHLW